MLLLKGTLNRKWYSPGDRVGIDVTVHCLDNTPDAVLKSRFRDVDNYFCEDTADALSAVAVTSITGSVVCRCVVDCRILQYALTCGTGVAAQHCPELAEEALPNAYRVYKLCCSNSFTVAEHLSLRLRETKTVSVTFDLPDGLPPSFHGRCLRFCHSFVLDASYRGESGRTSHTKLRIPIVVFSPQSVLSPVLLPLCFPMDTYDFREQVLLRGTSPLDERHTNNTAQRGSFNRRSDIIGKHLVSQRTPLEFPLSITGVVALTVVLPSTTVMIGSTLEVVFLLSEGCIPCVVRVLGSLEILECTFPEHVQHGVTCHKLPGDESRLVVTQTTTAEEFEWSTMGRPSVSVCVPFSNMNYCASMQTDAVTTLWQMRLRFLWCSSTALKQFSSGFRSQLKVEDDQPELVIPLTVVPPPNPEYVPRRGTTHEVVF